MATIIDGKAIAAAVRADVAADVAALKEKGIVPGLAVIIVGSDPASRVYVNNKKKACAEAGIYSEEFALPEDTTQRRCFKKWLLDGKKTGAGAGIFIYDGEKFTK